MIRTLLIANRGEIACRIIRTARAMGIKTVAVYSEVERQAKFVRMADCAMALGGVSSLESYLRMDAIINAAQQCGADAIHPGYGFLSENSEFAQACADNNLIFVGPPVSAIRAMGLKSESKRLMAQSSVPITPGYHGDNQDTAFLRAEAQNIGFPVLIKASAGGGGKGLRIVRAVEEFDTALASCQREAQSSFGSAMVLIERYIERPRHIEIQIFADTHGNTVHLFERDCTMQRRHQKVIEEAPAPHFSEAQRQEMGRAAVNAARSVGYVGAGTVEFIVQPSGEFYFMEMNTRLQVEHPVTEMITGIDLVEWQLRVAMGDPLPLKQQDIKRRGHAMEARLYAEDPTHQFLPSSGRLIHYRMPAESRFVRLDSGVDEGDSITPYYDPMMAKLIVWADDESTPSQTRESARTTMVRALKECQILGLTHNIDFLKNLVNDPLFVSAHWDTGLIERALPTLIAPPPAPPPTAYIAAALMEIFRAAHPQSAPTPWHQCKGWRLFAPPTLMLSLSYLHQESACRLEPQGENQWQAIVSTPGQTASPISVWAQNVRDNTLALEINGERQLVTIIAEGVHRHIFWNGQHYTLNAVSYYPTPREERLADHALDAPMSGKVLAHLVAVGAVVKKGEPLLIVEAMKMEHTITAPHDGRLEEFYFTMGEQVSEGQELAKLTHLPADGVGLIERAPWTP